MAKAIALKSCRWNCGDNTYHCKQGEEVEISTSDLEQAKASGLFEILIEEKPKTTHKKVK